MYVAKAVYGLTPAPQRINDGVQRGGARMKRESWIKKKEEKVILWLRRILSRSTPLRNTPINVLATVRLLGRRRGHIFFHSSLEISDSRSGKLFTKNKFELFKFENNIDRKEKGGIFSLKAFGGNI